VKKLRDLARDWRIQTIVPVVLIHVVAFGGLYWLMYRLAVDEVLASYENGAGFIVDEAAQAFSVAMVAHHSLDVVARRFRALAETHRGVELELLDPRGTVMASSHRTPGIASNDERSGRLLRRTSADTAWFIEEGGRSVLTGTRQLRNQPSCLRCHPPLPPILGALAVRFDLTLLLAGTRARLRRDFGAIVLFWMAFAIGMSFVRDRVIGRPMQKIERSISAIAPSGLAGGAGDGGGRKDLDGLAQQFHEAIWGLLEQQQRMHVDFGRQMERAEQLAALGKLAAGLSHEIKNPLAGIYVALEVLAREEKAASPERAELFVQMLDELGRVNGILEDLLRLSRPRPPVRVTADLVKLAKGAATLLEPRIRERPGTLSLDVRGEIPLLDLDSAQMTQVLVNLVTNAAQAIRPGGSVRISLAPFPMHDGAILSVEDDGEGIPAERLPQVFDPFFTTKPDGTGLGLPICRQVVEAHGGTISVESEPGKGTRVVALLPAASMPLKEGAAWRSS